MLYDGLDPERKIEKGKSLNKNYFASTLEQLKELQNKLKTLGENDLQNNLDLLKKLSSISSFRFDTGEGDNSKSINDFRQNNELIQYHANLTEVQILLNQKLNAIQSRSS